MHVEEGRGGAAAPGHTWKVNGNCKLKVSGEIQQILDHIKYFCFCRLLLIDCEAFYICRWRFTAQFLSSDILCESSTSTEEKRRQ